MKHLLILAALFCAALCAQPVTVVLVRHAEKASAPADNPPLTRAGELRATALASTLKEVAPAAIYVTEYKRTQDTAKPFVTATGTKPTQIAAAKTQELVATIAQRAGGTVLVVGHSNTIPEVIAKLGGPVVTIAETEYDRLFVLTIDAPGKAHLITLRYGAP